MDIYTANRKYYHEGREPKVLFTVNGQTHSGTVSNYWDNGITVSVARDINIKQNQAIDRLFFERLESDKTIEGLKVLSYSWTQATGTASIELYAPTAKIQEKFKDVFLELWAVPERDFEGLYKETSIPRFRGNEHYSPKAQQSRLDWARRMSSAELANLDKTILKPESLAGNIENFIGAAQIPIGLAGPVLVKGVYAQGYIPVPIATSEGALVSSISRGARLCNISGGIEVHVIDQCMIRAPVFFFKDMYGAIYFEKWVNHNINRIITKAESVSSVARVKNLTPYLFGDCVHLKFTYSSGDAAGQNMTTSCTWVAAEWIQEQIKDMPDMKYEWYAIEGNMSGDKKVNYQNLTGGRGIRVVATCSIKDETLQTKMRCSVKRFIRCWNASTIGASQVGMVTANLNVANPIAGIFTACGQDIASVHESAMALFSARETDDGKNMVATVVLPSLVIGTVGGGTKLPTARDCLEMMGCFGAEKSFRFAEIIAAACLSLEISTGSAICAGEFASAHDRLGRNRPVRHISKSEITPEFLTNIMQDKAMHVAGAEEIPLKVNSGIITNLPNQEKKFQGVFRYRLDIEEAGGVKDVTSILKIKSASSEINELGIGLARLSGEDRLPGLLESQLHVIGFNDSSDREYYLMQKSDPALLKYCPKLYGQYKDKKRDTFMLLMEDLSEMSHLDTVNDTSAWDDESISAVLSDLAKMHSIYMNRFEDISEEIRINTYRADDIVGAGVFLKDLNAYNMTRFPQLVTPGLSELYKDFINESLKYVNEMDKFPKTLTHNDFNTRNICLRTKKVRGLPRLCAYDWELAAYQNPQLDLIEFLIYALPENAGMELFDKWSDFYRKKLEAATKMTFDKATFTRILYLNGLKLGVIRFGIYMLAHNLMKFPYMDRVYANLRNFLVNN